MVGERGWDRRRKVRGGWDRRGLKWRIEGGVGREGEKQNIGERKE